MDHIGIEVGFNNAYTIFAGIQQSRVVAALLESSYFTSEWCVAELFFSAALSDASAQGCKWLDGEELKYITKTIWVEETATAIRFREVSSFIPLPLKVTYGNEDKESRLTKSEDSIQIFKYVKEVALMLKDKAEKESHLTKAVDQVLKENPEVASYRWTWLQPISSVALGIIIGIAFHRYVSR